MSTETIETFAEIATPANPFPGLRPFEFEESHLFFGRDGQSEQLISKLGRMRFLAVVGTSGSGKSSLVRAGLLPALLGGFMTSAGSDWRVAIMRPGNDPVGNLAQALNAPDVFGSEFEENAAIQTAIAEATLGRGNLGLVDAVRQAAMPLNENVLVLVDQFEEIFRFARVSQGEAYHNEAAAFVKLILEASQQRDVPIFVVLTMRSDYLGDCSQFWGLPEAINESQYLIPRLTRDQLREAITGPVAVGGGTIAPRLVNRLLNDVGDDQDQLPILQHALMRTWDQWKEGHQEDEPLDLPRYEAIGTMTNALSDHADEAYAELTDERSREIAEKIFKGLTEKGSDNREVRRPIELKELCALGDASEAEVIAIIEVFRKEGRSFLMPPAGVGLTGASLIDISHESLIRNWKRLKEWVEQESRSARIYRRLAETAVLHSEGRAGLWRDPDLQIALTWREQSKPNQVWAQRYHPEFELAMSFLDQSVAARDAETEEKERQRRRGTRRTRVTAVVFAFLFLLSMVALISANVQRIRANDLLGVVERSAEENKNNAVKAEQERFAKERAEARGTLAESQRKKEEDLKLIAMKKTAEADAERAKAVKLAKVSQEQAEALAAQGRELAAQGETLRQNNQLLTNGKTQLAKKIDELETEKAATQKALTEKSRALDVLRSEQEAALNKLSAAQRQAREDSLSAGSQVAFDRDGKLILTVSADGSASVWDASSHAVLRALRGKSAFTAVSFDPSGKTIATADQNGEVVLWDTATGSVKRRFAGLLPSIQRFVFSADSRALAIVDRQGHAGMIELDSGNVLDVGDRVTSLALSPDGRSIAVTDDSQQTVLKEIGAVRRAEYTLETSSCRPFSLVLAELRATSDVRVHVGVKKSCSSGSSVDLPVLSTARRGLSPEQADLVSRPVSKTAKATPSATIPDPALADLGKRTPSDQAPRPTPAKPQSSPPAISTQQAGTTSMTPNDDTWTLDLVAKKVLNNQDSADLVRVQYTASDKASANALRKIANDGLSSEQVKAIVDLSYKFSVDLEKISPTKREEEQKRLGSALLSQLLAILGLKPL